MKGFFEFRFGVVTDTELKKRRYRPSVTAVKSLRFSIDVLAAATAGSPAQGVGCVMSCRSDRMVSRIRTPRMFAGWRLYRNGSVSGVFCWGAVTVGSGSSMVPGLSPINQSAPLSRAVGVAGDDRIERELEIAGGPRRLVARDTPHGRVSSLRADHLDDLALEEPVARVGGDGDRGGGERRDLPGMSDAGSRGIATRDEAARRPGPVVVRVARDEHDLVGTVDIVPAGRCGRPARTAVGAEVERASRIDSVPGAPDRLLHREHRIAGCAARLARQIERLHRALLREERRGDDADDDQRDGRDRKSVV